MTDDPLWPRASAWLAQQYPTDEPVDLALIGVPTWRTSLSPTHADATPAAVRAALGSYSTWATSTGHDVSVLRAVDRGDVADPDGLDGEARARAAVEATQARLLVALGGDNSMTYPVAQGLRATGLVTLDAHHDVRDGASNGSPVRRLIEAGMSGRRVVQVGIADFANSAEYAARVRELGITVIPRGDLAGRPMADVMAEALEMASGNGRGRVHVDLDVDVCDRAVAPACPASVPGGLSAAELRAAARIAGAHPAVVGVDLTEVDATTDSADGRTVRLTALCVLEAAAGLAARTP